MSSLKFRLYRLDHLAGWAAIWAFLVVSIAHAYKPLEAAAPSLATVLETKIFVQSDQGSGIEQAAFDVSEAGNAILRVVNAAKVGAPIDQRVAGAEITLNGLVVVEPGIFNRSTDVLKLPVLLRQGTNRLGVKLAAKTGNRLSVRIDAPPDAIHLKPVADTLVIGESLRVEAKLTGLGRPVRDAQIVFSTSGLGKISQRSSSTDAGGVARTTLTGFQLAGKGILSAGTIGSEPILKDAVASQVVDKRSLVLDPGIARMRVAVNSEKPMAFNLRFLKDDAKTYHIVFEQTVAPDRGVDLQTADVPPGGFPARGPSTLVVSGRIAGRKLGTYMVTSRATVKETGETASVRIEVKVIEPQPAEALVLDPPQFVPAAISVGTTTPVRFAASVSGMSNPPAYLDLQEFNPNSGKWEKVPDGLLRDDGLKGDMIAGNWVYARRIAVTGQEEGDRRYRVAGSHDDKTVVSETRTLEVSRFFVGPDPDPPVFVKDPTTGRKFVAERVIVSMLPSVPAARIEKIVELATRDATGRAGKVGGYTRQINVYRIELVMDPNATEAVRATAVKAAVAEFETYDEVRYAHPNFLVEFAQVDPDGDSSGACSAAGQWGARKIQAPEAWVLPGGTGSNATKTVAVVDSGVKHDHPDLTGKVTGDSADLGDDSAKPGGHGTKVAGIISASHSGVGITGIAHGLPVPIWSFKTGSNFSDSEKVRDKIFEAADTPDVSIINISTESFGFDLVDWECALQYATYQSTPVGSACAGTSKVGSNGQGKLVVLAAGNSGRDISADPSIGRLPLYPCSYNLDGMLCVANTDSSDHIHATSNFGEETAGMDLAAPGTDICTTNKNNGYGHSGPDYTGTSMAAPHVSGAAAVLWSLKPGWTAIDVANRLKDTADPIDVVNPAAFAGKLGRGRLNLLAAISLNNAPELTAIETAALVYNEDDAPTPITATLTVSDVDDTDIVSATVQITNNYQNGQDVLGFTNTGNISDNWDASNGTLTLTGTDMLTNYQAALRTVTYENTSQNPSELPRTVSFTVNDGDADSNTVNRTINVMPVDDPYDIVFVLDRSGSMALTTPIDPPASDRWDALKRAVASFATIIESIGSTCTGSRFGLTLFASKVLSFGAPDPNFELHDNDFSALFNIGSGLQNKVSTELNLQTPLGSTALGAGLQNGIAKFNDDTRTRVIVLFSDGEQNRDPMVDSTGTGYEGGGAIAPGGTGPFKIVTIGIGSPNPNYLSILQGLASHHDGSYHSTSTGVGLEATLLAAVQDALDSCSPQMVVSHSGTLSNTVTLPAFDVNRKVNQLLLMISFGRDFKASEFAAVLAGIHIEKDGTDITDYFQPGSMGAVSNSVLLKADFNAPHPRFGAIEPEGSYTLILKKPESIDGNLGYRVVAYADDHNLDMDWKVSPSAPRVNQPFTLTLGLIWKGQALTKANVEVLILKAGDDLGDLLARHPIKVDPKDVDIFGSPGTQKYNYLLENDSEFLKRLRPNEQRFTLAHQGDGTYRAAYNPGDVSGIYQVLYRVRAEFPTAGKIQRVVMQSVYVRFGDIDLDRSAVSNSVQGSNVTISMRPITTYDRFIGPAQGSSFSVDGDDIKLSRITDHQDGSYTLVLTGKTDAQVTIKLLGEKIYQGPASKFGE